MPQVSRTIFQQLEGTSIVGWQTKVGSWARVADPLSANVRGAAFVAAVGLRKLKVEDIRSRVPIEKRYMPNPDHRPIYDELFKAFLEIHKNNEGMYNRLNK